jgi:hypothetical protein
MKGLAFLWDKASDRKFRLIACGCCRWAWSAIAVDRCREAVEVTENYADGSVTLGELRAAWSQAMTTRSGYLKERRFVSLLDALPNGIVSPLCSDIGANFWQGMPTGYQPASRQSRRAKDQVIKVLGSLLHELFGNPFRPVTIPSAWLSWNDATVSKLAELIYSRRCFGDLPILADALEEAGCDNADVLAHCRQPGEHVRGCWVIDLLLGKE